MEAEELPLRSLHLRAIGEGEKKVGQLTEELMCLLGVAHRAYREADDLYRSWLQKQTFLSKQSSPGAMKDLRECEMCYRRAVHRASTVAGVFWISVQRTLLNGEGANELCLRDGMWVCALTRIPTEQEVCDPPYAYFNLTKR